MISLYPEAERFIKPFLGAGEIIKKEERYCIWVNEEDRDIAYSIPPFASRFTQVAEMRAHSKKAITQKLAEKPYQFAERRYDTRRALVVPVVSSENRKYIPMDFVKPGTVVYYSAFGMYDPSLSDFAIINSYMHMLWVRATSGKLENRFRYSVQLSYNTFPFPKLTTSEKEELERLAQNILNIRDENYDMTLGEMYNPESMPEELREAHHQLDLAVERIYRSEPFTSDEERLEHLFKLYAKMTKK